MMKINKITIEGFRGFNINQEIELNEKLTVIFGPNSYGKTSISEALEWLLFGITSKVETSISGKPEYKGTYRNIHYSSTSSPFVEAEITINGNEHTIRGELTSKDEIDKYYDGKLIDEWPWERGDENIYIPFLLQHSLQDMLLAKPADRYSRFSKLLGTEIISEIQTLFTNFPKKFIPDPEVQYFLDKTDNYLNILNDDQYTNFQSHLKKNNMDKFNDEIDKLFSPYKLNEEKVLISEAGIFEQEVLESMQNKLKNEIDLVFSKNIDYSLNLEIDEIEIKKSEKEIISFQPKKLIPEYLSFSGLAIRDEYERKANFFGIGIEVLEDVCPFCGYEISESELDHIELMHTSLLEKVSESDELQKRKDEFIKTIDVLKNKIIEYSNILLNKIIGIVDVWNDQDKIEIEKIFGGVNNSDYAKWESIAEILIGKNIQVKEKINSFNKLVSSIELSINENNLDSKKLDSLGEIVLGFIKEMNDFKTELEKNFDDIEIITKVYRAKILEISGTKNLSELIGIAENYSNLVKYQKVKIEISSIKVLRTLATNFVSGKIVDLIEKQLTGEVTYWYDQIKTESDPEVHFDSFVLGGSSTKHEISIRAKSYGKELKSASSSLSESKLNALGFSIKVANNVSTENPFAFIVIDDPVQSLDAEHEIQIIAIIRKLIEKFNKQIILFSHNKNWVKQFIDGNLTINGDYYEMTGADKTGPHISHEEWRPAHRRLKDIDAICKNLDAPLIQLQHAEQEIRIVVCEITSRIYNKKKGILKIASKLNESKVRSMLLECGLDLGLVDRISLTFSTSDDSHHAPDDYSPVRERIIKYHSWVHELLRLL